MRKTIVLAVAAALLLCLNTQIAAQTATARSPLGPTPKIAEDVRSSVHKSITSKELSDHVNYLASEELQGRGTGAEGGRLARDYIVKKFKSYGLKPGGDTQTYTQKFSTHAGDSWNVVGYVEGSDPKMKAEVVVVGAHYDHLGSRRDGTFYPGADDNASGTAGVLEIAEAFSGKGIRLKRTVLFICFGAEEVGLLGSRHYCEHPRFPLEKTVAMLNLDMIARNDPDEVIFYGLTLSPALQKIVDEANSSGMEVQKAGLSQSSDHYSFHVKGVPAIFVNSGMHPDLHMPTDTPDKCDFKKAEKITELVALTAVGAAGGGEAGVSGKPTRVSFDEKTAGRLKLAVRKAGRGDLGGALRIARRALEDGRATEEERADAQHMIDEIEKRRDELFAEVENLLEERMPCESKELLAEIRKAFSGMEEARKAQERIKQIDSDQALRDDLAAGKLFAKAIQYEARGKNKYARKYFRQVVEKYPDTEYAMRAKEKLQV